jgi:hypothetical protein
VIRREEFITTRTQAGDFFRILRLLMALGLRGRRQNFFLPLPHALPITARLLLPPLPAVLAGPIPLGRPPP